MIPKVNEAFHPDPKMISLYYLYLELGVAGTCLSWMIPVIVASLILLPLQYSAIITSSFIMPLSIIVIFIAFWIPKYYSSIRYTLTGREIIVEKGVYWKRKSIVPYNRVTNIDIVQGPLARRFGLGTIRIQTAGFSTGGGGGAPGIAEAVIMNIKNFEELKDTIMDFVRGMRPTAVEAEAEVGTKVQKSTNQEILNELRKIRKLLAKKDASRLSKT